MNTRPPIRDPFPNARRPRPGPEPAYPVSKSTLPEPTYSSGNYDVQFAWSPEDLDRVAQLRFEVFNLELGEGLDSSYELERDLDEYDPFCHHLMVCKRSSCTAGELVGTYRIQTAQMARQNRGFYTKDLFDLSQMPDSVIDNSVELSRACVAKEFRSQKVLFLLWRGLAGYLRFNDKRYLFGCCSLTSQDAEEGRSALGKLQRDGAIHPEYRIEPVPGRECLEPGIDAHAEPVSGKAYKLPKLFRIYLRYGAKVCGPPVIDREFKTIDFPVLFDIEAMDPLSRRLFFASSLW